MTDAALSMIPLEQLMLSKLNVRQTERASDIEGLADSIATFGLKQNLIVVPAHFTSGEASEIQRESSKPAPGGSGPWQGRYEVIAGGRRFQALSLLVERGTLPASHPVACKVETREEAAETSLLENLERVDMNPADEFDAYRVIVARHSARPEVPDANAIEICAKRFSKSVKYVEGRLRLATLAPAILEALRDGTIGVDCAKAYASVDDHALQMKVFEAQTRQHNHHPTNIRFALRGKTLSANDPTVKFIGLDAYIAAGGLVQTEMFMGSLGDEERLTDIKLVERLAKEKAEPLVAPQAKKDGFKSGLLARGVGNAATWPKAPDGMDRFYSYYESKEPTKAELKKCVAVYAIDQDGAGIVKLGHYRPPPVREPKEERDWAAERAATLREEKIIRRAGQLAVYDLGKFTGTPFEGHAFWPAHRALPIEVEDGNKEFAMVAVLVRVPVSAVEGHRDQATQEVDAEEAEAKKAALDIESENAEHEEQDS